MNLSLDKMPFNWFDAVLVGIVIIGLRSGRKHGMSEELIGLLKWLSVVIGCAMLYPLIGSRIAESPVFDPLRGYLLAYFGVALIIASAFAYLKKAVGGKLVGSDVFGRSEFYLGMLAGMVRWVCMLVAALAMLNARLYTKAEAQAEVAYQNDVYGSSFFPTLQIVQSQVFERSLAGPWIKDKLGFLLIKPTPPEHKELKQKEFAVP